jgi:hypothetical protein
MWNVYQDSLDYLVSSVIQLDDSSYFLTGTQNFVYPEMPDIFFARIDKEGNLLWKKNFGSPTVAEAGGQIIYSQNGSIKTTIQIVDSLSAIAHLFILNVDISGNVTSSPKPVENSSCPYAEGLLSVLSNGYLFVGNNGGSQPCLLKTDTFLNTIWVKNLDYDSDWALIRGALELVDHNLLIWGKQYHTDDDCINDCYSFGLLAKLDSSGNALWSHTLQYGYDLPHDVFFHAQVLANKNILLSGAASVPPISGTDAWLLKVDSNGCLDPGCITNIGIIDLRGNDYQLLISPNPAPDEVLIQYNLPVPNKGGKIIVYDLQGRQLKSFEAEANNHSINLDPADYPAGMYFIELRTAERSLTKKLTKQ